MAVFDTSPSPARCRSARQQREDGHRAIAGEVLTDLGTSRVPLLVAGVIRIGAGLGWWLLLRVSGAVERGSRPDDGSAVP